MKSYNNILMVQISEASVFEPQYVFAYTDTGSDDIVLPFYYSNNNIITRSLISDNYSYSIAHNIQDSRINSTIDIEYNFSYETYVYKNGMIDVLTNNYGEITEKPSQQLVISNYGTIGPNDILFVVLNPASNNTLTVKGINFSLVYGVGKNNLRGIKVSRKDILNNNEIDTIKLINAGEYITIPYYSGLFEDCISLKIWYDENRGSTLLDESMTQCEFMFKNCTNFNGDISQLNTSNITNMNSMFYNASSFNQDIGNWDVSNVEVFNEMFSNASSFNQDIGGWDVENAIYMVEMFKNALNFNQDISDWNVNGVEFFSLNYDEYLDYRVIIDQDALLDGIQLKAKIDKNEEGFMVNTSLSPENYSNILIKWSQEETGIKEDIKLINFYPAKYLDDTVVRESRLIIINRINTLNDGGIFVSLRKILTIHYKDVVIVDSLLSNYGGQLYALFKAAKTINQFVKHADLIDIINEFNLSLN